MSDEIVQRLARAFQSAGKEFYLVGGTVRDALLGRDSHDIDCCTNALPDEIKQIAATTEPLHIVPIGEKFGTIQLHYRHDVVIEVTTYRGERYTPGSRKPEVQFGMSLHEDLRRRDFTINAIAQNPLTGYYVDPWYGRKDIERRLIRAVDDPAQRFKDDPLRLIRAVRFATQFDFAISEVTESAMLDCAYHIQTISQERIRDEIGKLLLQAQIQRAFQMFHDTDLIGYILPEVQALIGVEQPPHHRMDVFNHTMTVVSMVPSRLSVRLAALLHDVGKPVTKTMDGDVAHFYDHEDIGAEMARKILQRLRYGNDIVEHVAKVVKLHMRVNQYTSKWSNGSVRRLYLAAGDAIDDLLDLAVADGASDRNEPREEVESRINELRWRIEYVHEMTQVHPLESPLDGRELMEIFERGSGSWIGMLKVFLTDLVIDGTLQSGDKESAIVAARGYMERCNEEKP